MTAQMLEQVTNLWAFTYTDILAVVMSAVAISVSIVVFFFTRPIEKKQHQLAILQTLYQALNSKDMRDARIHISDAYWACYPDGIEKAATKDKMIYAEGTPTKEQIRKLTGAFDAAGVLVVNRIVEPKLFFDLYGGMVVRTWKMVQEDVDNDRKYNKELCRWFIKLNEMALEYYKTQELEPPAIFKRQQPPSQQ